MKKTIFFILLFLLIFPITVFGETESPDKQMFDETGKQLQKSVTQEAEEFFEDNGITLEDSTGFTKLSVKDVFGYILKMAKGTLTLPLRLLGMLLAVIVLISVVSGMGAVSSTAYSKAVDIVGVLVCVKVMFDYIAFCINITFKTIETGSQFMMTYVPVFASVVGAGGSVTSAAAYHAGVLFIAEIAVQISVKILMPMLSVYLAFAILEAVNPELCFSGFANGIKKGVQWALGLIMTIFVGLITIQSIIGTSADTVAIRAAKFAASSFIPVIGGAISDAYTTVKGSLGLLRSGVGTFGIIVLLLTMLPSIISVTAVKLSVNLAAFVSEIVGVKRLTLLMKNVSSVLSIALSLLVCFLLMLIISTTVMMLVGLNMG